MKKESLKRLSALCSAAALMISVSPIDQVLADIVPGTYIGTGQGKNGDITVSVKVENQKIEEVTVLSQEETQKYWDSAKSILESFIGKSSAEEVDTVSGATVSCNGIKQAVNDALAKADVNIAGSGTQEDPYVILNSAQLGLFANKVDEGDAAYTNAYVVLGHDIDLSGIESWNPIGAEGTASINKASLFAGTFDGRGMTISGMKISEDYSTEANVGLFSTLGETARIRDVVMTEVSLNLNQTGSSAVIRAGGIAGDTQRASSGVTVAAIVDGCSVSGSISVNAKSGKNFAGGILGRGLTSSAIINCTADVQVSSVTSGSWNAAYAGVIAGMTGSNTVMANCAAFGSAIAKNVSGGADAYAGGLAGMLTSQIYNCYADASAEIVQKSDVSKQFVGALAGQQSASIGGALNYYSSSANITVTDENGDSQTITPRAWSSNDMFGKAKAEDAITSETMRTQEFADTLNGNIKASIDGLNNDTFALREWKFENGRAVLSDEIWVPSEIDASIFEGGAGSESDPYLISNETQLKAFAGSLNSKIDYSGKYVKLADNIELSNQSFTPIGGSFYRFNGDFDGNGKTISGLTIGSLETPAELDGASAYVGLFGWINEKAYIHDLSLDNVLINTHSTGSAYVGGIAGRMNGSNTEGDYHGAVIDGCSVKGSITHVTDKGTSFIGGIVGHMFKGAVINSFTDAALNAKELSGELAEVGGMVGLLNRGVIANCYALGSVTGSGYRDTKYDIEGMACVGNIAAVDGGYIVNCYGEGDVEALEYSIDTGIITGWVTGIAKAYNCYYNEDASMIIDGRKVIPVDPFGETVAGGVSDEYGFKFPGSLVDNIIGYHPSNDAKLVADGLNASFDKFPIDIGNIYGLSADSLKKWEVKDGRAVLSDEKAAVTYIQPEIEKKIEEETEKTMLDGIWYGRSNDKSSVVSVTVRNGEIIEVTAIEGETSDEAVARAKFKAYFGDTSDYKPADMTSFMGSGTQNDPYRVENESQLRFIADSINEDVDFKDVYFIQTRDITVTGGDWSPIGWGIFADADDDGFGQDVVALYPFRGHYDGANYTIKGLKAGSKTAPVRTGYMGLFGIVQGDYTTNTIPEEGYRASIKNVRVEDAAFYTENRWRNYIGVIAANAQGGFEIDNCYASGVINSRSAEDFAFAGGLSGSLMYGSVTNTSTNVDVNAWSGKNYSYAGGMSAVTNRATIVNSFTLGDVHADADQTNRAEAGGFIALDGGTCINCYAKGSVEIVSKYSMYIGGFAGMAASASEHRQCCYNVDAAQTVAGNPVAEKRYAGKFVNESAEANAQEQTADFMSSLEFAEMLNENRNNITTTLSQVKAALDADENGSSKYHSVYYNGNENGLNEWEWDGENVDFGEIAPTLDTKLPDAHDGIISLCGDIQLSDTAVISEDTVLDLRGYTITGTKNGRALRVDRGKLTIIDSSEEQSGNIVVPKKSSSIAIIVNDQLDMQAGTVTVSGQDAMGIRVQAGGSAQMSGGKIASNGVAAIGAAAMDLTPSTFTLSGGEISVSGQGCTGIYLAGESQKGIVTGGKINVNGNDSYGIQTAEMGATGHEVEISGGSITASGNNRTYGVYLEMDNKLTVTGGSIESTTSHGVVFFQGGNSAEITGGTVTGSGCGIYILNSARNKMDISGDSVVSGKSGAINAGGNRYVSTPAVTIRGGYFNGKILGGTPTDKTDNYAKYDIKGGYFTEIPDDSALYNYDLAKNYTPETYTDEIKAQEMNEFGSKSIVYDGVTYLGRVKKVLTYHEAVAPTCTKDGTVEYWEDVNGLCYSDENGDDYLEDIVVSATGHAFTKFLDWIWNGLKSVVALFTCENDENHIATYDVPLSVETTTEPTCTQDGYRTYTATIDVAGVTYTTTKIETIDQIGHKWGTPSFEWSDDFTAAEAVFTCQNDSDHVFKAAADVTLTDSKEPTRETDGENTYTATVEYEGTSFSDTKVQIVPKLPDSDNTDNTDNETDTKPSGSDTDTKKSDSDTDTKKLDSDTDTKTSGSDTDTKTSGSDTETKTLDSDTDTKKLDSDTDTKTSDSDTETKTSDSDTDTKTSGSDTDTKTSDSDTDTKTSDSDTETKTSSSDTDTKTSGSDTDTKTSGSDTDTKTSDSDTEIDTPNTSDTPDKPNTSDTPDTPIGNLGDLDRDGQITSADALYVLRMSVGFEHETPESIILADVDGDGQIASSDALAILRYSAGKGDNDRISKPITA